MTPAPGVVAIGASWGGLHAIGHILATLPDALTWPVLIVQHRARDRTSLLAALLQDVTRRSVRDAEDGEALAPGIVRIAPPDRHLLVRDGHLALSAARVVRFSRPSIDVTFESVAAVAGLRAIAVVLTGANDDGACGARQIAERGGHVLVQALGTAEVRTMPQAALDQLRLAPPGSWSVAPLDAIADRIALLAAGPAGATPVAGGSAPRPRRHRSLQ